MIVHTSPRFETPGATAALRCCNDPMGRQRAGADFPKRTQISALTSVVKLSPHPQAALALGLWNTNWWLSPCFT